MKQKRAEPHFKEGISHAGTHNYGAAVACFDKAIMRDPENAKAHHYKGYCLGQMNRHEKAPACFEEESRLKPDSENAILRELGGIIERKGRLPVIQAAGPCGGNAWFMSGAVPPVTL